MHSKMSKKRGQRREKTMHETVYWLRACRIETVEYFMLTIQFTKPIRFMQPPMLVLVIVAPDLDEVFRAVQALRENLAELRNTSEPIHYYLSLKRFPEEDFTHLLDSEGGQRRNLRLTYYHGLDFARLRIRGFGSTFCGDFSLAGAKIRRTSLHVSKQADESYVPGPSTTPWLSLVLEVGYTETMPQLRHDAQIWWKGSGVWLHSSHCRHRYQQPTERDYRALVSNSCWCSSRMQANAFHCQSPGFRWASSASFELLMRRRLRGEEPEDLVIPDTDLTYLWLRIPQRRDIPQLAKPFPHSHYRFSTAFLSPALLRSLYTPSLLKVRLSFIFDSRPVQQQTNCSLSYHCNSAR